MKALLLIAVSLITSVAANAIECSPTSPEPFTPFLERFSTELKFAERRVVLPLLVLRWEYGVSEKGQDESAPVKSFLAKKEYLTWPTLDSYIKSNNLKSVIDNQTRMTAVLKVFKPDTDWLMLYHFKLRHGCWFFWQYEDQSL